MPDVFYGYRLSPTGLKEDINFQSEVTLDIHYLSDTHSNFA